MMIKFVVKCDKNTENFDGKVSVLTSSRKMFFVAIGTNKFVSQ